MRTQRQTYIIGMTPRTKPLKMRIRKKFKRYKLSWRYLFRKQR